MVENLENESSTGIATFQYFPKEYGTYISKINCFCYDAKTLKAKEKQGSASEQTEIPADQTTKADSAKSDDTNKEDTPAQEVVEDSNSESSNESEPKSPE